jgi:hypothetical protein
MTRADRVHSTPPTNTPVDPTLSTAASGRFGERQIARWFQSDLSIGDRCEILEGDDFSNRLVARAETPVLAAMIVADHNARLAVQA